MASDSENMASASQLRPAWAADATLRAIWAAIGEPPEWIASRTEKLITTLGAALDISDLETPQHEQWEDHQKR
jgi:hypothetical protein